MIYSEFVPDRGLYRYYEVPEERVGLGDDLATPSLEVIAGIGAASTALGRSRQGRGRFLGQGTQARGVIAPLDRSGLTSRAPLSGESVPTSAGGASSSFWFTAAALFSVGVVVGIYATEKS